MPIEQFVIPICRHLKTNGTRCQSPALNAETFCYFHLRLHKDHPAPLTARQILDLRHEGYEAAVIGAGEDPMQIARAYPRQNEFNFPPLEDAESIQFAASMLFHAISQGQIHLRRARLLRDILRVANASCRRATTPGEDAQEFVHHIDRTPDGVVIAGPDDSAPATECVLPEASPDPQLPSDQDSTDNPFSDKIIENPPELTAAESGF